MASINQVVFTGNVAQEPKILQGQSSLFGDFRLAVSSYYRKADGTSQEETIFLTCKVSGKVAEIANLYLTKGAPVGVTGQMREESWTDKETGQKVSRLVVRVDNMSLMETKAQREFRESRNAYSVNAREEVVPLDTNEYATAPRPAPKPAQSQYAPAPRPAPKPAQSQYAVPQERGTLGEAMAEVAKDQHANLPEIDLDEIPF